VRYAWYMGTLMFVLVFIPAAFSQDDVIDLNHEELGRHSRPPVKFNHERHQQMITECMRCHHDYDERMTNIGGEGQYCAECHGSRKGKNTVPLMKAFHMQCKGCHEDLLERCQKGGPIICGQCHRK